jgi:hypothetical protein
VLKRRKKDRKKKGKKGEKEKKVKGVCKGQTVASQRFGLVVFRV